MAECRLATESGALPWGVLVPHQDRRVTQMPVGFAGLDYSPMQHLSFHFSALSSSGQHRTLPFVWVVRVVQFDCKRMHPRTRLEPIGIDKCQSSAVVCVDRAILKPCWPLSPPPHTPPKNRQSMVRVWKDTYLLLYVDMYRSIGSRTTLKCTLILVPSRSSAKDMRESRGTHLSHD